MNGAQLMRGEPIGPPVPPRDIDRYPRSVLVDFRRCQFGTLKKYCARYDIVDNTASAQPAELAACVAKHFEKQLQVEEEAVLKSFTEYVLNYSGGNTLEDVKFRNTKRLRKRTRRTGNAVAFGNISENSEEEVNSDEGEVVLYCICNRPSFGEMIACDGPDCQSGEWFHLSCVGLKEGHVPVQWWCPDCEKKLNNGDNGTRRKRAVTKKRLGDL